MGKSIDLKQVKKHRYVMIAEDLIRSNSREDLIELLADLMMKVDKLEGGGMSFDDAIRVLTNEILEYKSKICKLNLKTQKKTIEYCNQRILELKQAIKILKEGEDK